MPAMRVRKCDTVGDTMAASSVCDRDELDVSSLTNAARSRVNLGEWSKLGAAHPDAADLSPFRQHDCQGEYLRSGIFRDGPALPLRPRESLLVGDRGARRARATDSIQPRAACRGK